MKFGTPSPQSLKSFFDLITEKYNDVEWVPVSRCMPHFHSKLQQSFELKLQSEKLTVEQATQHYKNTQAQMNVSLANWRKSGNGSGNLNQKIRVTGTEYCQSDGKFSAATHSNFEYVDF